MKKKLKLSFNLYLKWPLKRTVFLSYRVFQGNITNVGNSVTNKRMDFFYHQVTSQTVY